MGDSDASSHWYFAYGSMCNPISLKRRGIIPSASTPAKLNGFKLSFSLGGMANIVADASATCHGILHYITAQMFEVLKKIESTYDVVQVDAIPYQPYCSSQSSTSSSTEACNGTAEPAAASGACSSPIKAAAFIVLPAHMREMQEVHPEWHASLPTERYITIIQAGLKHYGADPAWIAYMASQAFTPSKQPCDYLKFPTPQEHESLKTFTLLQLAEYEGRLVDGRAVFACGRKVIEVDVSSRPNAAMVTIMKHHFTGRDAVFGTCMNLYEPRLPPLTGPQDVTEEHIAWAEDACMDWVTKQGMAVRQIGWLGK